MVVRTRFAPSPTGYLHLGGARTALFSWLYARKNGGQFVLRIEDTDLERSTQASIDAIVQAMEWLGLDHDEGPFYQTQRLERYKKVAAQWLAEDKAYYCECSHERLAALRAQQIEQKLKPKYDGLCRERGLSEAPGRVLRFKTPLTGSVAFVDEVKGSIEFANDELDDLILVRSDGIPTYNFAVVVDDVDMAITHVIRGDDHVNNTPRQIHLFHALAADVPVFAHVPMILGSDGQRLSKRHGAVSVMQYRDDGFLPEALLNYLVRLGWSHGNDEIFSREAMIESFGLSAISRSPASFNPEKLLWLNHHYLKSASDEEGSAWLRSRLAHDAALDTKAFYRLYVDRCKTLTSMAEHTKAFVDEDVVPDESAQALLLGSEPSLLSALHAGLLQLEDWTASSLHDFLKQTFEGLSLKFGQAAPVLRAAVLGTSQSPSIDQVLVLLGKTKVLRRLQRALDFVAESG